MKSPRSAALWKVLAVCALFTSGCTQHFQPPPKAQSYPAGTEQLPGVSKKRNNPSEPQQPGMAPKAEGEAGGPQPAPSRVPIPGQAPAETFGSAAGKTS